MIISVYIFFGGIEMPNHLCEVLVSGLNAVFKYIIVGQPQLFGSCKYFTEKNLTGSVCLVLFEVTDMLITAIYNVARRVSGPKCH